jgi:hypothetical protein
MTKSQKPKAGNMQSQAAPLFWALVIGAWDLIGIWNPGHWVLGDLSKI